MQKKKRRENGGKKSRRFLSFVMFVIGAKRKSAVDNFQIIGIISVNSRVLPVDRRSALSQLLKPLTFGSGAAVFVRLWRFFRWNIQGRTMSYTNRELQ